MGERRPGRDHELRLTMSEAAKVLNTSRDAIRMRVRRGSLASELGEDGKRYVYVEPDRDGDPVPDRDHDDHHDLLYSEMRERIAYLERQVEEEREARRRADMLLARLVERVPEIEAPQDAPGSPVLRSDATTHTDASGETQEATEDQRGWFRRFFGV